MIHNLRAEPMHVRKNVLVIATTGITVLIVAVWLITFNFSSYYGGGSAASIQQDLQPLSTVKDDVVQMGSVAASGIDATANTVSAPPEMTLPANQNNQ